MGGGGVPSGGVYVYHGRFGDLPVKDAKPNSRYDLYVNGKKAQSRWFDNNGKVFKNKDYFHQDSRGNHEFPHFHEWVWKDDTPFRMWKI